MIYAEQFDDIEKCKLPHYRNRSDSPSKAMALIAAILARPGAAAGDRSLWRNRNWNTEIVGLALHVAACGITGSGFVLPPVQGICADGMRPRMTSARLMRPGAPRLRS